MRNISLILTTIATMLCTLLPSRLEAEDQTTATAAAFEYVGSFGGTISAVRKVGAYTYVGQGSMLRVFNNADCNNRYPREIAHLKLEEPITYIDSHGLALLVQTEKYGVRAPLTDVSIVNVENPSKPQIVILGNSSPYVIHASNDNRLLVESQSDEEELYDITNPLKPVRISSGKEAEAQLVNFPQWFPKQNDRFKCDVFAKEVYDVRVINNTAYLLDPRGFTLVDVSSPDSPRYLSQLSMDTTTTGLDCSDKYLAVSDEHNVVHIYGLSKARNPVFIKSIAVNANMGKTKGTDDSFTIQEIQMQNSYLCAQLLGEGDNNPPIRVVVYDVSSSATQPVVVNSRDSPYNKKYKIGFGQLLKYRVLDNKYWVVTSHNDESYLGLLGLSSKPNLKFKPITRLPGEFREENFGDVRMESNRIFVICNLYDTGSIRHYIEMMIYASGSISSRSSLELTEGGSRFFVQGNIVYTISDSNSLIMYKIR